MFLWGSFFSSLATKKADSKLPVTLGYVYLYGKSSLAYDCTEVKPFFKLYILFYRAEKSYKHALDYFFKAALSCYSVVCKKLG